MDNEKREFIVLSEKRYVDHITGTLKKIEIIEIDKKFYDFCKNFKKTIDK